MTGGYHIYHAGISPQQLTARNKLTSLSIDIGVKNFALRLEERYSQIVNGKNTFLYPSRINVIDFTNYTLNDKDPYLSVLDIFARMIRQYPLIDLIVVEQQLDVNYVATRIFQHVISIWMTFIYTGIVRQEIILTHIHPSQKYTKSFHKPESKLNQKGKKDWGKQEARYICEYFNDQVSLQTMFGYKKQDDLADTIVQLQALLFMMSL